MAGNFVLMTVGAFYFYPRLIGTFFNCCYACCHLVAWVLTLAARFNPLGRNCVLNVAPIQYEGDGKWNDLSTYKKDGSVLAALGAMQALLWCIQCYCCSLPLYSTPNQHGSSKTNVQSVHSGQKKPK